MSTGVARNAATAIGFGDRPPAQSLVRLVSWRAIRAGKLRGFASVELMEIGLILVDLPVFVGSNGFWAALPRKAKLNSEKRQWIGADGRPSFEPVAEWKDRATDDRFSAAIVAAIRARYPDSLEDGEAES